MHITDSSDNFSVNFLVKIIQCWASGVRNICCNKAIRAKEKRLCGIVDDDRDGWNCGSSACAAVRLLQLSMASMFPLHRSAAATTSIIIIITVSVTDCCQSKIAISEQSEPLQLFSFLVLMTDLILQWRRQTGNQGSLRIMAMPSNSNLILGYADGLWE